MYTAWAEQTVEWHIAASGTHPQGEPPNLWGASRLLSPEYLPTSGVHVSPPAQQPQWSGYPRFMNTVSGHRCVVQCEHVGG